MNILADAILADQQLARLSAVETSATAFNSGNGMGADIKTLLPVELKVVLGEYCKPRRIVISDFVRDAIKDALVRELTIISKATELSMSIAGPEDADTLNVRVGVAK